MDVVDEESVNNYIKVSQCERVLRLTPRMVNCLNYDYGINCHLIGKALVPVKTQHAQHELQWPPVVQAEW
jgi:hypothetical protein